jgi:hypothetical protein
MLWMAVAQLVLPSECEQSCCAHLEVPGFSRKMYGTFSYSKQQLWLSVAYIMCSPTAGWCRDFSSCLSSDCRAVGHWCKWCAGRIKVYWPWSWLAWHGECTVKNTKGLEVFTADISSSNLALDVSKMTSWFCLTPSHWCQTVRIPYEFVKYKCSIEMVHGTGWCSSMLVCIHLALLWMDLGLD